MKLQLSPKEIFMLVMVTAMSAVANLPEGYGAGWFNRKLLLGALAAIVVIAMFRYLQALLLIIITVLAAGANLPRELAENLGVSQPVLLAVLGLIIALTLLNRVLKLVPTYAEPPESTTADDVRKLDESGARVLMMEAIAHGKTGILRDLLERNTEVNFTHYGSTPLHLATEKGYPNIVQLLIDHGADLLAQNAQGNTALDVALELKKFAKTTDILYQATIPLLAATAES